LQGISNPVPRVQHPDWLHKKMLEKNDAFKQRRINEMFKITAKPVSDVRDIEDTVGSPSTSGSLVPVVTNRKRVRIETNEEPKTWREALGSPPEMGTTREELVEWIKFQKKKWRFQLQQRKNLRGDNRNKRTRHDDVPLMESVARGPISSLGGFMKRTQRNLIELPWQVIQIVAMDQDGHYNLWAKIGDELQKIKLEIPRIFYVNQRTPAPPCEDESGKISWKKVHRILPRARPTFNLYQYTVPEQVFRDNGLGMLVDLAAPDIEGIYETQMSLEFRALMQLGCTCAVQRNEASKIAASGIAQRDSFSLNQLEQRIQINPYLKDGGNLKKIFMYHHTIPSGKKSVWGLFLTPTSKALIIVHDSVRTNQVPTMKNLYLTERQALLNANNETNAEKIPPNDLQFDIHVEIDLKQVSNSCVDLYKCIFN
jgi:DNA polymerase epsilon subunit 1